MDKLRILLLGPPVTMLGEKPVRIQRRLTRCLLFYLACQTHPPARADLILLFWPEANEQTGRRRLREILSKLRNELPDPCLLVTDQDLVGLNRELYTSDVQEFENCIFSTRGIMDSNPIQTLLPEQVYLELEKAVNLWRSPNFLSGTQLPESRKFEHWAGYRSSRLEMARQVMLERLADHQIAKGSLDMGIGWLMQALVSDELNIELNLKLLGCLARLGRRREAIVHCQRLEKLFQEEEDRQMPEELLVIYNSIRNRQKLPELY